MGYLDVVDVNGVPVYTRSPEIASCLRLLVELASNGGYNGEDPQCLFKAIQYLKKYKSKIYPVMLLVARAEEILAEAIRSGKLVLYE